jgi:hypothetical protein
LTDFFSPFLFQVVDQIVGFLALFSQFLPFIWTWPRSHLVLLRQAHCSAPVFYTDGLCSVWLSWLSISLIVARPLFCFCLGVFWLNTPGCFSVDPSDLSNNANFHLLSSLTVWDWEQSLGECMVTSQTVQQLPSLP